MKRIAIIGECMIELNGAPFGAMQQTYGGDSLNTAVYLARTAGEAVNIDYITAMGTDALSQGMVARWQQEGINTEQVLCDEQRQPGLYLIQLDEQGERTFLYWRNQSAARYLLQHPDFDTIAAHLAGCDLVYLSGISLAILPAEDRARLLPLLKSLSQQGVAIAFDSNYRPALWQDLEETRAAYSEILSFTELALLTFDDEQAIWGDEVPEAALSRLYRQGVKKAVLKLGAEGCLYGEAASGQAELIGTTPVARVVDTTSAGDAFNAGFLAGYLTDQPAALSCRQGHQLAGIVIQHKGAIIPASATADMTFTTTRNA